MESLPEQALDLLLESFVAKSVPKKSLLLQAGKIAREVYFIKKGCLRLYYEKEGADISAYFFTEMMFAGAYDSFISQKASRHAIESLEDCDLLCIGYADFQAMLTAQPEMNLWVRKILEERFVGSMNCLLHKFSTAPKNAT